MDEVDQLLDETLILYDPKHNETLLFWLNDNHEVTIKTENLQITFEDASPLAGFFSNNNVIKVGIL